MNIRRPHNFSNFQLLILGQGTSALGDAFYLVGFPWLVLRETRGLSVLGATLSAYGVMRAGCLYLGGFISDRIRPWSTMMFADFLRFSALAVFLLLLPTTGSALAPCLALGVALGCGDGIFLPASFSIIPSLVNANALSKSNGIAMTTNQLAMITGPLVAGFIVNLAGARSVLGFDAFTFVLSASILWGIGRRQVSTGQRWQEVPSKEAPASSNTPALTAPWFRDSFFVSFFLLVTIANLAIGSLTGVVVPYLARRSFHSNSSEFAILLASLNVGLLIGTFVGSRFASRAKTTRLISAAMLVQAGLLAMESQFLTRTTTYFVLLSFGFLTGLVNIKTLSLVHRRAQPGSIGKMMGLLLTVTFGTYPISVILAQSILQHKSMSTYFGIAAFALVGGVFAANLFPDWRSSDE